MWNHFHLVIETPRGNLVAGMKWLVSRVKELLAQRKEQVREHTYGEERAETEVERAQGIVRLGWTEGDLGKRRKGDPGKLKLALRLRAETAMTLKGIAERLPMGAWTHLNHLLYWHRRKRPE